MFQKPINETNNSLPVNSFRQFIFNLTYCFDCFLLFILRETETILQTRGQKDRPSIGNKMDKITSRTIQLEIKARALVGGCEQIWQWHVKCSLVALTKKVRNFKNTKCLRRYSYQVYSCCSVNKDSTAAYFFYRILKSCTVLPAQNIQLQ